MSVSPAVAAALLAYAAATDNRTVTEEAARAWADVLDDHVNLLDGKAAIIAHRRSSTDYLMPIHINREVRRIRGARTANIDQLMKIPGELAYKPMVEGTWRREFARAIGDGVTPEVAAQRAYDAVGLPVPARIEGTHRMPDVGHLVKRVPEHD